MSPHFWVWACKLWFLQLLQTSSKSQCNDLLEAAAQKIVLSLHTITTQVAANVNPALVQLQVLDFIQSALIDQPASGIIDLEEDFEQDLYNTGEGNWPHTPQLLLHVLIEKIRKFGVR